MKYQREFFFGAVVPSTIVGIVGTVISLLLLGRPGLVAGIFAMCLVFFFLALHLLVAKIAPRISPIGTMGLAMASYGGKILGIVLALLLLKPIEMDRRAFGIIAISSTIAWLAGEVRAFTSSWRHKRPPIHEERE